MTFFYFYYMMISKSITAGTGMRNFFISYNQADRRWAEWVGWQLEEQRYTVFLQDWDLGRAGEAGDGTGISRVRTGPSRQNRVSRRLSLFPNCRPPGNTCWAGKKN